ncbi:AQG_2a_G0004510.mRNA.1.CDS.1 [Saccharomyces cerevisiae]|uniref:EC1118_1B15_4170p n=4 Tax=Saccharomyces TaxID=4930 RepID=D3UEY6_YEAS8|nr:hypothetical protein H814_YJM1415B00347 [Saccharomyces cerevisiae YJM1415]AJP86428.1 hypothetical protein H824_YJM1450B00347 [Saccharomyces cerevisiae YJM1450]AJP87582.1 hypothetical protein H827_YJM1477B00346 [Saccharomyces cerevisiae YJM1477]AJP88700.1 hypothetical protein H830_YJM1526B00347 [Saccharomyces cerevisiae YJM1526]AJP89090.1 hypothetical protein H831_YJM1527B00346 [Saccharomyces cerevisiae YJM1527]AJP90170.1 hypothetical protein H834_YJM1574B00273 [Saccharomyces cerevisiae YJM1
MIRLAQQTQVLKGKPPNQFVPHPTKNSLTHPMKFNGTIAMEHHEHNYAIPYTPATFNNPALATYQVSPANHFVPHFGGNIGANNNNRLAQNNSNNSNNHHNNNRNHHHNNNRNHHQNNHNHSKYNNSNQGNSISPDSPWFHKVCAFEDCVSQTLYMSQTPRRQNMKHHSEHPNSNANPLFWDSIGRAMGLYHDLLTTPELNSDRVSKLVHLLHNGLRANRNQLTRMNKKPDYDSQSFHKEMTNYLCKSLREISEDVLNGKVELNEYGAMHLITAFKELLLFEEAVDIWKAAINGQNTYTSNIFLNPRVVGVILPILYDNGVSYPEIQALYEKSSSMINYFHPNLSVGMIRASLSASENDMALKLFQKLCQESTEMKYGYLIETHLSFIGECKDLNVAQTFFDKALNDEMPYKIDLQVSYVKSFLRNIWSQTRDFNHIYQIWYKSSLHYGRNVNHGISSSLNDTFFDIFFENYAVDKMQGFQTLQNIIQTYNNIKHIDEPFFNIILAKCTVWHDRSILEYIDKSYEAYHIPKTIVAYRILLKSMGSVDDASNAEILQRWMDLIRKSDEIGQRFIANADWAALRDATVTWTQNDRDSKKSNMNSTQISRTATPSPSLTPMDTPAPEHLFNNPQNPMDFYSHPALQAATASGAFDEFAAEAASSSIPVDGRMVLYLKIVKRYSPYCRDSRQLARLTTGTAVKYSVLQEVLNQFQTLIVNDIPIPELHNLKPTCV